MRRTRTRRRTRLSEEQVFERFCLELEYNEKIGNALRDGVETALDRRQRAFDAMLAVHPATLAEKAGRAEARQLDEERLERIATRRREREARRKREGVERLACRWGARLVRRAG